MIFNLKTFSTDEDLEQLTGLTRDGLWDHGFCLDDYDIGFQSDVPLARADDGRTAGEGDALYPVDGVNWLVNQMNCYCVGYYVTHYRDKYYYMVYHA